MRATFALKSRSYSHMETQQQPAIHDETHALQAGALDAEHHAETGIHVELAPEIIGNFYGLPITNTLLTSWIAIAILLTTAVLVGRNLKLVPNRVQTAFEALFEFVLSQMEQILESKVLARRFFPLIVTIFLFISFANVTEFIPGIGSLGIFDEHGVFNPLLRSINTDLNVTLALALISFVTIEVAGVATIGFFKYGSKFINFSSPMKFIVGIIELISEVSRLISFSFRLFGNIFAGEVLIAVIAYFVPYVIPVPFMAFEMFIGVIQGLVFALLTLLFIKMAIAEPH